MSPKKEEFKKFPKKYFVANRADGTIVEWYEESEVDEWRRNRTENLQKLFKRDKLCDECEILQCQMKMGEGCNAYKRLKELLESL